MPTKTAASGPSKEPRNFTEDYLADWGSDDDPFRSPSPEPGAGGASKKNEKKRKGEDILGIDEQIDLTKKARVPRVKLDETRLLSEKGIPELQRRAKKLRLKGKGHEVCHLLPRVGFDSMNKMSDSQTCRTVLRCRASPLILPTMARRPLPQGHLP